MTSGRLLASKLCWVLLAAALACSPGDEQASSSSLESAGTEQATAESEWLERSKQAVVTYGLSSLPVERLTFEVLHESTPGERLVDVREKRDAASAGDPSVSPRLFSLLIDTKTGAMTTDALSLSGEFEPLRGRDTTKE